MAEASVLFPYVRHVRGGASERSPEEGQPLGAARVGWLVSTPLQMLPHH